MCGPDCQIEHVILEGSRSKECNHNMHIDLSNSEFVKMAKVWVYNTLKIYIDNVDFPMLYQEYIY